MKNSMKNLKKLFPQMSEEQSAELEKALNSAYEKGKTEAGDRHKKNEFENALNAALIKAAAKNVTALKALLDMSAISMENGELNGLSEQIDRLKRENGYLFSEGGKKPEFTAAANSKQKMTSKEFEKLSYKKRLKLFKENPELYKQLTM